MQHVSQNSDYQKINLEGNVEQYMTQDISVNDLIQMFTQKIQPNTPPYKKEMILSNNDLIDTWNKDMLQNIAKDGKVNCKIATEMWKIFEEGMNIIDFLENTKEYIPRLTDKHMNKIKCMFLEDITSLINYGVVSVSQCWNVLNNEISLRLAEEKYEKVFSKDVEEWYELSKKHHLLFENFRNPLFTEEEFKDVLEKVKTILSTPITPDN